MLRLARPLAMSDAWASGPPIRRFLMPSVRRGMSRNIRIGIHSGYGPTTGGGLSAWLRFEECELGERSSASKI